MSEKLVTALIEAANAVGQNFGTLDDGRYVIADPYFTALMLATAVLRPDEYLVVHLDDAETGATT